MADGMKINIGCGTIYHPDWVNLDIATDDPAVMQVDITRGLPFDDLSASACYSSHVLEHMDSGAARFLLDESFRVLRAGGVLRIAVPDLEAIAREYLALLGALTQGNDARAKDYDWIMLEMYDQVARNRPGGEMASFLTRLSPAESDYVRARIGEEAERIWATEPLPVSNPNHMQIWRKRFNRCRLRLAGFFVALIAGRRAARSFQRGIFRDSGEVHQWMFDRYSLGRMLKDAGFVQVRVCQAHESGIQDFGTYDLDTVNGKVRKPDSLFIEAIKP